VELGSVVLRALHVSGNIPGTPRWDELLDLADRTALNAVMRDLKDESGSVWGYLGYRPVPGDPLAFNRYSLSDLATELDDRDLRLILRVVAFQDPKFAENYSSTAVLDTRTGGPFEHNGQVFLDPSDSGSRAYIKDLVSRACRSGVYEIQLDYIRFPDGLSPALRFDNVDATDAAARTEVISSFITDLQKNVGDSCLIAADIFGFVTSVDGDGGIGQQLEAMADVTDVLSPMVYPNHWSSGWFGYSSPAANPGGVVTASMTNAIERVGNRTTLRPWLQDFGGYGANEVRAQIDAADALGLGWMLWNASSQFTEAALPTDAEVTIPTEPAPPTVEHLPASGYWDVADTSSFTADVAWLGAEGITRGCNPPWRDDFCPKRGVTRAEAAAFLVRALNLPPAVEDYFGDDGNTHEDDINALA
jgi:hypothetical protein